MPQRHIVSSIPSAVRARHLWPAVPGYLHQQRTRPPPSFEPRYRSPAQLAADGTRSLQHGGTTPGLSASRCAAAHRGEGEICFRNMLLICLKQNIPDNIQF